MSSRSDLSTLPQRMRYAAEVLAEAEVRYSQVAHELGWDITGIRSVADKFESEDRADDEHTALIEELAKELSCAESVVLPERGFNYAKARRLIESGWRKGDPA